MSKLNEPILPDDYPIYGDYLYVVDGKVIASDWHGVTARELRLRMGAKEVRRCDIGGRAAPQAMSDITDAMVERAARAMAIDDGKDPDGFEPLLICWQNGEHTPVWLWYEDYARAALRAALEAKP